MTWTRAATWSSDGLPEVPIVLLKEYAYCPRIAYYKYFSVWEPPTESMRFPSYTPEWLEEVLASNGYRGRASLEVPVRSRKLGVYGRVDAVLETGDGVWVVEVKLEASARGLRRRARHHLVQLAAYVVAVEETLRRTVKGGLVASLSTERVVEVPVTQRLRAEVYSLALELRRSLAEERLPPPTTRRQRCSSCFYRKACPR